MAKKSVYATVLKVFGVLELVAGILAAVMAVGLFSSATFNVGTYDMYGTSIDASQVAIIFGAVSAFAAVTGILAGVCAFRFVKDPSRTTALTVLVVLVVLSLLGNIADVTRSADGMGLGLIVLGILINAGIIFSAFKLRGDAQIKA